MLRKVWETERLRDKAPISPAPLLAADDRTGEEKDNLLAALHTLHARAGMPTAYEIAVAGRWRLTPDQVTELLNGAGMEEWEDLERLLFILGGDQAYFRPLWEAARATTADQLQANQPPPAPEPPLPPVGEDISERVPDLLERFSGVLGSRPNLSPRQQRVLQAKREAVRASLVERIDGHAGQAAQDEDTSGS